MIAKCAGTISSIVVLRRLTLRKLYNGCRMQRFSGQLRLETWHVKQNSVDGAPSRATRIAL
jgi:hypothetical protein